MAILIYNVGAAGKLLMYGICHTFPVHQYQVMLCIKGRKPHALVPSTPHSLISTFCTSGTTLCIVGHLCGSWVLATEPHAHSHRSKKEEASLIHFLLGLASSLESREIDKDSITFKIAERFD